MPSFKQVFALQWFSCVVTGMFKIGIAYLSSVKICTSSHMFKSENWDKFQKMNEENFPQILQINMWFLVNHMWQALRDYTRVKITQKAVNQYQQI